MAVQSLLANLNLDKDEYALRNLCESMVEAGINGMNYFTCSQAWKRRLAEY